MKGFQRARKPEEKEARRRSILVAAQRLAREVGPIELSLNEVGRRSGVSKPNIYRYFEGREEILLCLLVAEMEELVDAIERGLKKSDGEIASVARIVAREFLAYPLLCQLLGMTASIVEHNLSADAIAATKRQVWPLIARLAGALRRALPWLTAEDAPWAVNSIGLYVAGMWPTAHPSPAAASVVARPEFAPFAVDAGKDLQRFLNVFLSGLKS